MFPYRVLALVLITAALCAAGCSRRKPDAKVYLLRGEVLAVDSLHLAVTIAHEEIPGFMKAMTMTFRVREPAVLREVAAGDSVEGDLEITDGGARLNRLTTMAGRKTD